MAVLNLPPFLGDELFRYLEDRLPFQDGRSIVSCPVCGHNALMVRPTKKATHLHCMNGVPGCHPNEILRALQKKGFDFGASSLTHINKLHVVPVARLIQEYRTPRLPVVEGLIPDKSLTLLAGKAKVGKSLLAIDILAAIACGEAVFGGLESIGPAPVVYMGMEDGPLEMASRFIARGMDRTDCPNFHVVPERFLLTEPAGIQALRQLYHELKPALILVDTAREALGIKDWANATELSNRLRPIREFARECCSVVLVTHNRKRPGEDGDEICGSSAFTSSVDGWISVSGRQTLPDGSVRLTLKKLGRGGIHGELLVDMHPETLRFSLTSPSEVAPSASSRSKALLEAIYPEDGRITASLAAAALQTAERNAQRLLQRFVKLGWIAATGELTGENGRAIVYGLTASAPAVTWRPHHPPRPLWDVEAERAAGIQAAADRRRKVEEDAREERERWAREDAELARLDEEETKIKQALFQEAVRQWEEEQKREADRSAESVASMSPAPEPLPRKETADLDAKRVASLSPAPEPAPQTKRDDLRAQSVASVTPAPQSAPQTKKRALEAPIVVSLSPAPEPETSDGFATPEQEELWE